jgi:hypothetical protein
LHDMSPKLFLESNIYIKNLALQSKKSWASLSKKKHEFIECISVTRIAILNWTMSYLQMLDIHHQA